MSWHGGCERAKALCSTQFIPVGIPAEAEGASKRLKNKVSRRFLRITRVGYLDFFYISIVNI